MRRFCTVLLILLSLSHWLVLAAGKDGGNVDPDAPETVWMPDAKLRQAVRDRLGIEDDEALSKTQMTQLTELRVHDTDIEALTGLEYATNLYNY